MIQIRRHLVIMAWGAIAATAAGAQEPAGTASASPSLHAPKVVCENPTHNFGQRDSSETVEHTFVIRNEGDLTLEIGRVRPSCGCTVANLSKQEVAPGESAELRTALSLKGRSGRQRKNIRVETNDPDTPNLMLYLEGVAVNNIELNPRHIYFGQISQTAVATSQVEIVARVPLEITGVRSTSDQFVPHIKGGEANNSYILQVITRPPLELGSSQATIVLNRKDGGEISVPASVMVVGPLAVAPKELVVKEGDDRMVTRYIIIRAGEVKEFEVTGVEVPHEQIVATTTPLGANGYRIQLDHIPSTMELDGGKVVIKTDTEKMPVIEIPFKIVPMQ